MFYSLLKNSPILQCSATFEPADKTHADAAKQCSTRGRDDGGAAAEAVAAEVGAAAAEVLEVVIVGNFIGIQRHCPS
jgi:hypothetical protein